MSRHVVANVDEIAPGARKIVTVKGREIGIFHVNDDFFGLINRCPHQGAPLCRGEIVSRLVAPSPGDYRLDAPGRDDALPLALLGVRHPHRPVAVRSRTACRRALTPWRWNRAKRWRRGRSKRRQFPSAWSSLMS